MKLYYINKIGHNSREDVNKERSKKIKTQKSLTQNFVQIRNFIPTDAIKKNIKSAVKT